MASSPRHHPRPPVAESNDRSEESRMSDHRPALPSRFSMTRRRFVRGAAMTAFGGSVLSPLAMRAARGAEPKRGGTFKILQTEPAVGFNPVLEGNNFPEVMRMVYNGLTDMSPSGELVPDVARSWTASPEGDTFTFQLQPGVMFHDGKELTAADVKFTFESILDPKTGSPLVGYVPN